MNKGPVSDTWERGSPYEQYIGRWSRRIAPLFVSWLDQPLNQRWLDVGCGTGALSAEILDRCAPASLIGVEPSEGFRKLAAQHLGGRAILLAGDAANVPLGSGTCDVVVAGLVLNFVPDPSKALAELIRVAVPGGTIAAYVWDYAGRMEIIRSFWDAAAALDPAAALLHEGVRFPDCNPTAMKESFEKAGLDCVATTSLEITAEFANFDDYWHPFLGGQGPAPTYAMSLTEDSRAALEARLAAMLPAAANGSIRLPACAWAVRGTTRGSEVSGRP
jgi:SAM-dependent methyltransferase